MLAMPAKTPLISSFNSDSSPLDSTLQKWLDEAVALPGGFEFEAAGIDSQFPPPAVLNTRQNRSKVVNLYTAALCMRLSKLCREAKLTVEAHFDNLLTELDGEQAFSTVASDRAMGSGSTQISSLSPQAIDCLRSFQGTGFSVMELQSDYFMKPTV